MKTPTTDKEKLLIYVETAGDLIRPKLDKPESEALIIEFDAELAALVQKYLTRIDTL